MIDSARVAHAADLIKKGEAVLQTARAEQRRPSHPVEITDRSYLDYSLWAEWRNQSLGFLHRTLGETDNYSAEFARLCNGRTVAPTKAGLGILRAVKQDLEGGHLAYLSELVHASVFSDFLEMAEHLLDSGYKDAAAVIGGGVLEEHLRLLCVKNNIETDRQTPKGPKAKMGDAMNIDLASSDAYGKLQQKIIVGWLGIRNSAAHRKYDDYTSDQVADYLSGIREFVNRYGA